MFYLCHWSEIKLPCETDISFSSCSVRNKWETTGSFWWFDHQPPQPGMNKLQNNSFWQVFTQFMTSTWQKCSKCCPFSRLLTRCAALWWVCHIPPCKQSFFISFFFIIFYQKNSLCKKSALAFEAAVAQILALAIPVFCHQTGFSSASMTFYQTKTVCLSAASLQFAKHTLDSMVLNEASFGLICFCCCSVLCRNYICLVSLSNKWWKNSLSSTWFTENM